MPIDWEKHSIATIAAAVAAAVAALTAAKPAHG